MDLQKLKYFCSVVEAASLRQAAETLRVSPGALSKAIKSLESELGTNLFLASGRSLVVTDEGRMLHERSRKLLLDFEDMTRSIGRSALSQREQLRIGTYCIFSTYFLDALLHGELSDIPILQKRIPPGELEDAVANKVVDVGLTFLPYMRSGLEFLPITDFTMQAFARQGQFVDRPFAEIPFVSSVADVKGSAYNVRTIDGWPYQNVHRHIRFKVAGLDAALGIARRGLAAVYCPAFTVALHNLTVRKDFRLTPINLPSTCLPHQYTVYLVKRAADIEDRVLKKLSTSIRRLWRTTD